MDDADSEAAPLSRTALVRAPTNTFRYREPTQNTHYYGSSYAFSLDGFNIMNSVLPTPRSKYDKGAMYLVASATEGHNR